ncbi:ECF transporter S component [Hazenella coriacea]|uniref:Riboflavin transporter n=1 Tax=Hazenella coriacea TaxID=1179467 RepID=A0A4R3LDK9_9BACL|nr:ECF transporter S component [Hazenella coriacea]TCS95556.1 riboflavin transporter FmnP [Hazenella coriacea]
MQQANRLRKLVLISILGGSAFIMEYLNFPLPYMPSFLKLDFSDIPALICAFIYGPLAGIGVQFLKNVLHLIFAGSETGLIPVGQIANFIAGSIFVTLTVWVSRKVGELKGLVAGAITATLIMTLFMTVANWYVIFPAYSYLINWTVTDPQKMALVFYGVTPFNVIKGVIVSMVFIPLYLSLKPYLDRKVIVR